MKRLKLFDYILYSAIIALGIALDQVTKLLAVKYLSKIETKPLIRDVLHLTYVENDGAAFGMLDNARWVFISISTVSILVMLFVLFAGYLQKNKLYSISLALIVSGGIGNMIDRLALGYVVDFIDFRLINFAVFNGADSFVCVGAGLLILGLLLDIIKEQKNSKRDEKQ